jgi:hypothetical protein
MEMKEGGIRDTTFVQGESDRKFLALKVSRQCPLILLVTWKKGKVMGSGLFCDHAAEGRS